MSAPAIRLELVDLAGATTFTTHVPKNKLDGTVAPGSGNDDSQGYTAGSLWADKTGDKVYLCVENATGAAIWREIPSTGGSGPPFVDSTALLKGSVDATKRARFEVDGLTTGTTRVMTIPNYDITLAGLEVGNVYTTEGQRVNGAASNDVLLRLTSSSSGAADAVFVAEAGANFVTIDDLGSLSASGAVTAAGDVTGDSVIALGSPGLVGAGPNITNLNASNLATGTLPAGRFPILTGDVTTPGASLATTIGANKVTVGMLAQLADFGVLGRSPHSAGNVAGIFPSSGDQVLRTDVSGSTLGFGTISTLCIADDAVTYAKIQNVGATQRVLGRKTAGAGDTEEVTLSELLDFVGSAAQGDILYRGAATWARLGAGTAGGYLKTGGAGANPSWAGAAPGPRSRQVLTSGAAATYTTPAGCIAIHVREVGGGGGGGGAANTAGNTAPASGGGAGGYSEKWFFSPAATYTYTVGAGGNGGAAGNNNGTAGGTTTFDTMTALGGTVGVGSAAGTTAGFISGSGSNGVGANGDILGAGEGGTYGYRVGSAVAASGAGGSGPFGAGGGERTGAGAGTAGTGYGAGGGGALSLGGGTAAGGNGTGGVIIVEEFY